MAVLNIRALESGFLAYALALTLAVTTMPVASAFATPPARCTVGTNICHPLQSTDIPTAIACAGPLPSSYRFAPPPNTGDAFEFYGRSSGMAPDRPEIPPPK